MTEVYFCQWPECNYLAITQCKTTLLGWMKLCTIHRRKWDQVSYKELVKIHQQRRPVKHFHGGRFAGLHVVEDRFEDTPRPYQMPI